MGGYLFFSVVAIMCLGVMLYFKRTKKYYSFQVSKNCFCSFINLCLIFLIMSIVLEVGFEIEALTFVKENGWIIGGVCLAFQIIKYFRRIKLLDDLSYAHQLLSEFRFAKISNDSTFDIETKCMSAVYHIESRISLIGKKMDIFSKCIPASIISLLIQGVFESRYSALNSNDNTIICGIVLGISVYVYLTGYAELKESEKRLVEYKNVMYYIQNFKK